jgi:hypothetical protein
MWLILHLIDRINNQFKSKDKGMMKTHKLLVKKVFWICISSKTMMKQKSLH